VPAPNLASLPRIGGLATMPSRMRSFSAVIENILPQLDRLYVFFDKYDEVPSAFANREKIVALSHRSSARIVLAENFSVWSFSVPRASTFVSTMISFTRPITSRC